MPEPISATAAAVTGVTAGTTLFRKFIQDIKFIGTNIKQAGSFIKSAGKGAIQSIKFAGKKTFIGRQVGKIGDFFSKLFAPKRFARKEKERKKAELEITKALRKAVIAKQQKEGIINILTDPVDVFARIKLKHTLFSDDPRRIKFKVVALKTARQVILQGNRAKTKRAQDFIRNTLNTSTKPVLQDIARVLTGDKKGSIPVTVPRATVEFLKTEILIRLGIDVGRGTGL